MEIRKIIIGLLFLILALVPQVSALPEYKPGSNGVHVDAASPGCAGSCHNMPVFCARCHGYPYGTTTPTTKPTTQPTTKPTTQPTTKPTTKPTTQPTTQPTAQPPTKHIPEPEMPIPPVPELSPLVLTATGISGLLLIWKIRKS